MISDNSASERPKPLSDNRDKQLTWAQLFKSNNVISKHIVKTLIIKYGIMANIFAEKMWVAFAKATHIFSAKIPVN